MKTSFFSASVSTVVLSASVLMTLASCSRKEVIEPVVPSTSTTSAERRLVSVQTTITSASKPANPEHDPNLRQVSSADFRKAGGSGNESDPTTYANPRTPESDQRQASPADFRLRTNHPTSPEPGTYENRKPVTEEDENRRQIQEDVIRAKNPTRHIGGPEEQRLRDRHSAFQGDAPVRQPSTDEIISNGTALKTISKNPR